MTLGSFVEVDVTFTIFIQFVESFPVADGGVAWKLRYEVVEHRLSQDFALATYVLRSVSLACRILYFFLSIFTLVSFDSTLRQLTFCAKLLKL